VGDPSEGAAPLRGSAPRTPSSDRDGCKVALHQLGVLFIIYISGSGRAGDGLCVGVISDLMTAAVGDGAAPGGAGVGASAEQVSFRALTA
jgi:hypothetical protein